MGKSEKKKQGHITKMRERGTRRGGAESESR